MVKNEIWLRGASKQNAPFLKTFAPFAFEDLNSFIFLTCFLYERQNQSGSGKKMVLKI